jgi:hypothetical protein
MDRDTPYQYQRRDVYYENDSQYRACLRKMFCMITPDDLDNEVDEVTMDENDFDGASTAQAMDFVFVRTNKHTLFCYLYDQAAAKMLSTDREIGLAVLFSYDYMALFHKCIQRFLERPDEFTEGCDEYKELHNKIT